MNKWSLYLLSRLAKYLIKGIFLTCRVHVHGMEDFIATASKGKCILALWHSRLTLVAEIMTRYAPPFNYAAVISNSRDAHLLALYTESYKNGRVIRVPHNARAQVLQTIVKQLKTGNEVIIITPDGPRGPPFRAKPGIAYASKEAKASIVPLSWSASSVWRFKTWDKLMLPKPFSTITVHIGKPLTLANENDTGPLEEALNRLSK